MLADAARRLKSAREPTCGVAALKLDEGPTGSPALVPGPLTGTKRRTNRGALPAHVPRVETLVDINGTACPCCSGALHKIGEDVSERLDVVPAQF